jgi:glycosyltransferase involved in cell wall biosynthesis
MQAVASQRIVVVALGAAQPPQPLSSLAIHYLPFQADPAAVARCYQAADVYIHAARADTFPTAVIEALACGVPVVATAIGGIPEQIAPGRTGLLTPPGDAIALASAIAQLLSDATLRQRLGWQAHEEAKQRFALDRQVTAYLDWYAEVIETQKTLAVETKR